MTALALTAADVAELLGYLNRRGEPQADVIRAMYRAGSLPAPIDPAQPVQRWRWSRASIEAYVAGEWSGQIVG